MWQIEIIIILSKYFGQVYRLFTAYCSKYCKYTHKAMAMFSLKFSLNVTPGINCTSTRVCLVLAQRQVVEDEWMNEQNKHFDLNIKLNLLSYFRQYRAPVLYVLWFCWSTLYIQHLFYILLYRIEVPPRWLFLSPYIQSNSIQIPRISNYVQIVVWDVLTIDWNNRKVAFSVICVYWHWIIVKVINRSIAVALMFKSHRCQVIQMQLFVYTLHIF